MSKGKKFAVSESSLTATCATIWPGFDAGRHSMDIAHERYSALALLFFGESNCTDAHALCVWLRDTAFEMAWGRA